MRHSPHPPPLETHMRAAWPTPLTAAEQTPGLWREFVRLQPELQPRVAAVYAHLQALPRRVRRALQRHWGVPLATLALWLALGQLPALAATILVGGACTLVDAITAANTDTATSGCAAGSGADTIVLPPGSMQTLSSVNNDTFGPTGLPVVESVLTIAGQGSTIARAEGAPEFRLLAVHSTGDLTLEDTTVSGGIAPVISYGDAHSVHSGGGVANYGGTLTVTHSTITGNVAAEFCFPIGYGAYGCYTTRGGGVANFGGTCTVTHSTISDNTASSGGGVSSSGTCTVTHSTISGNTASSGLDGSGGGVANYGGTCTITNSTIAGNTADGYFGGRGGGVANVGGTCTVTNSTIAGNTATYGVFGGNGGGLANADGTVTVLNSTITGNAVTYGSGGGVLNYGGTLTLGRTLVSGNTASPGPELINIVGNGTVTADQSNLFGLDGAAGVEGFTPGPSDVVPPPGVLLPAILEPTLALHGGRTPTQALVSGSPAIDAAGPVCLDATGAPLLTDQRGRPRPVDGNGDGLVACDIGAFEFFPLVNDLVTLDPDLDTGFDPTPVSGGPAGTFTVTATFTNTSPTALRTPFFEVTALSGGNLLLNADAGPGGVGATLTPDVGDGVLAPGETVAADFVIGLQVQAPFTFVVELFGEPVP